MEILTLSVRVSIGMFSAHIKEYGNSSLSPWGRNSIPYPQADAFGVSIEILTLGWRVSFSIPIPPSEVRYVSYFT